MKSKLTQQEIISANTLWQATRPMGILQQSDMAYKFLLKEIYYMLDFPPSFSIYVDNDQKTFDMRLACIITGWFEDFVNEWGIWQAFTQRNREQFGKYIPIIDNGDYDPEYINPADLHFLIWLYFSKNGGDDQISPNKPYFSQIAAQLTEFLEDKIDQMPLSEVISIMTELEPGENFFEMRTRLEWLGTQSYLFGLLDLSNNPYGNGIREAKKDEEIIKYTLKLEYLYNYITPFGNLRVIEMAARIFKGDPETTRKMVETSNFESFSGTYHGIRDDKYLFTLSDSTRTFEVNTESIDLPMAKGTEIGSFMIRWNNEIWMQGAAWPLAQSGNENLNHGRIPLPLVTQKEKEQFTRINQEVFELFKEVLGGRIRIIAEKNELFQVMQELSDKRQQFNANKTAKTPKMPEIEVEEDDFPVAVFLQGGAVIAYSNPMAEALQLMQSQELLSEEEEEELFEIMVYDLDFELAEYLHKNYPEPKIPQAKWNTNWWTDLLAFKAHIDPESVQKTGANYYIDYNYTGSRNA